MKKVSVVTSPLGLDKTELLVVPVSGKATEEAESPASSKGRNKKGKKGTVQKKNIWENFDTPSRELIRRLDKVSGGVVEAAVRQQEFVPKPTARLDVVVPATGKKKGGPRYIRLSTVTSSLKSRTVSRGEDWRRLAGDAIRSARRLRVKSVGVWVEPRPDEIPSVLTAVTEGLHLGDYSFDRYKSKKDEKKPAAPVSVILGPQAVTKQRKATDVGEITAKAVSLARDLVNMPPSDLLPADLVRTARSVAKGGSGVRVKAFGQSQLKRLGAGGILSVSRGSSSEPFLIHMSYVPRGKSRNRKRIVLIGKGVTFDSGGLSIKPGKGMEDMKCDMAGAAAVIATMQVIASLPRGTFQHELHVLVPATENMVNSDSIKPGDVFFTIDGKSVEVLNTDAEGRLILADALSYSARLKPDLIIDLATLTGACIVAIGNEYAGLFANDEKLGDAVASAAKKAGELMWPLPLAKEYRSQLDSPVANLKNIGSGGPGATLGALFLEEFVPPKTPWVHLDIAGPAFLEKGNEYTPRGGTGFGVRTLVQFLLDL